MPPEVGTPQDDAADGEAARRAVMLSQLASADESRPGTLERILQQASMPLSQCCMRTLRLPIRQSPPLMGKALSM